MAFSKVTIVFNALPTAGQWIRLFEDNYNLFLSEEFKANRTGPKSVKIPVFVPEAGDVPDHYDSDLASNYMTAFNLDYNASLLFNVTKTSDPDTGLGTVVIEANYQNAIFSILSNEVDADITIENESDELFEVDEITFSTATNTCTEVRMNVTTTSVATQLLSPVQMPLTSNDFYIDVLRGVPVTLSIQNDVGVIITQTVIVPAALNPANFNVGILNSPNGSTITITMNNSYGISPEYSLDGITYQSSNVFSGLSAGNYTLYVRDKLGCSFQIDFQTSQFTPVYNPFVEVSKSNSIRYAKRINFGNAANYKKDENTLSEEVDQKLPYRETQLFQSADVITTQIKSSYAENTLTIIKPDNTTDVIPFVKMSNNMGVKSKLDAIKSAYNGKTKIYFTSGNTYDYNTGVANGTHTLNGLLPEWAKIGNLVQEGSAWFFIDDVFYDEVLQCDCLVYNSLYAGADTPVIIASVYDLQNYEVYEAEVDFDQYIDMTVRASILCHTDNYTDSEFLSEKLSISNRHEQTVDIHYWNESNNSDIYYQTGIRHRIRIPVTFVNGYSKQQSESNITDSGAYLTDAELYEGDEFVFEPVTKEIMRKILRALSHEKVYIDEVGYVKDGDIEVSEPQDDTNLYLIKAKMLKTGNVYTTQTIGIGSSQYSSNAQYIPGLIQTSSGFVKY